MGALIFAATAGGSVSNPQSVSFTGQSGTEFSGRVATFASGNKGAAGFEASLDWGDGTPFEPGQVVATCAECDPPTLEVRGTHTYQYGGSYDVRAVIKDTSDQTSETVTAKGEISGPPRPGPKPPPPEPEPPSAALEVLTKTPRSGYPTLLASKSKPGSSDIVKFEYDFGDGQTSTKGTGGTGADHIYAAGGTYPVRLRVTDANGKTSETTGEVKVIGSPSAKITFSPKKGNPKTLFKFRGNGSTAPGGKIVRWQWYCSGSPPTTVDSSKKGRNSGPADEAGCRFHQLGSQSASLTVTTDDGVKASAIAGVQVKNKQLPSAAFALTPAKPVAGQTVTFDGSASKSNPAGDGKGITDYLWRWSNSESEHTTTPTVSHVFPEPRNYKVKLVVTDAEGKANVTQNVNVIGACETDVVVRGLTMHSDCLRKQKCPDGSDCYVGAPDVDGDLNGMTLHPKFGAALAANPTTGQVGRCCFDGPPYNGAVVVATYADFPLDFDFQETIPEHSGSVSLGQLDAIQGSTAIKGLKIGGIEPPVFNDDGTSSLAANLRLPKPVDTVSGRIVFHAATATGVELSNLHVDAKDLPLGPVVLTYATFDYDQASNSWKGTGAVDVPSQGTFGGGIEFVGGEFNHLDLFGDNLNYMLGDGVFLQRIAGGYTNNPLRLDAAVGISVGPVLSVPGAGEQSLLAIDGTLALEIPEDAPWKLSAGGTMYVVGTKLATASAYFSSDGVFGATGHFTYDYLGIGFLSIDGDVGLTFLSNEGRFQLDNRVDVCAHFIVHECAGGELVISNAGIAGCIYLPSILLPDVGGYYRWSDGASHIYFSSCSVGAVKTIATRAQAAGQSRSFTVGDVPSEALAFVGRDGPPDVVLTGPKGERIVRPADGYALTEKVLYSQEPSDKTTYVMLGKPSKGKWTATVADGSTPVTSFKLGDGLPDPSVKAKVSGRGLKRKLTYEIAPIEGQSVRFVERGRSSGGQIGGTSKTRGTIRFTPGDGPAGRREVVAEVEQNGAPRRQIVVAHYTTAEVTPGRPRFVRARRSGRTLKVTWGRAARAKFYDVQLALSDGRRQHLRLPATTRTLTLPNFLRTGSANLRVAGYRLPDRLGPAAKAKVKPVRAKKRRHP